MKMSVKCIACLSIEGNVGSGIGRRRDRVVDQDWRAVAELELARGDDLVAVVDPLEHGHLVAARRSGRDEALPCKELRLAVGAVGLAIDNKNSVAIRII